MGKYQAYPAYKDSGVEWLQQLPDHWSVKQLKFLCTYNDEVISENFDQDGEIEYIDIGSVSSTKGIISTELMLFANAPSRARRKVKHGDVIISTVRTYLEAVVPILNPPENLVVSTGFAVIRPTSCLEKGFAAYCLRSSGFIKRVVANSVGVSYPAINASDLVNIKTPVPSFEEQQKIAAFLDHETAKIDALIEKQQQLIQLLKEKRQAVISHAVTKGLNPNAPMKDSGIEWLGEVPAHWEVLPIKHACALIKDGTHLPPPRVDIGVPLLSVRNIIDGQFLLKDDDSKISKKDYQVLCKSFIPEVDDVVLAIVGATLGKAALVKISTPFHVQRSVAVFRTSRQKLLPFMLKNIFDSQGFQSLLWEHVGFSAQPGIYLGVLANFQIPIPPIAEQLQILSYLNAKLDHFHELGLRAETAVKLLQERRTALISAAVTGKIDVRDFVVPA